MTRLAAEVELRNRFIRETFGRYPTDQVVDSLVGIARGTEDWRREGKVTMLMADLRGSTALSERLDPKEVVTLLNRYLSEHGRHHQEIRRDDRAIYRRCDLRTFRRRRVEGGVTRSARWLAPSRCS